MEGVLLKISCQRVPEVLMYFVILRDFCVLCDSFLAGLCKMQVCRRNFISRETFLGAAIVSQEV